MHVTVLFVTSRDQACRAYGCTLRATEKSGPWQSARLLERSTSIHWKRAYCGVPITSDAGQVLGTLCHFDEQATERNVDLAEMLQIPRMLRGYLPEMTPPAN